VHDSLDVGRIGASARHLTNGYSDHQGVPPFWSVTEAALPAKIPGHRMFSDVA
jgi:hypothetical protein